MENNPVRAVIGAGEMGHGIAIVLAMIQGKVWLYDISDEALESADANLQQSIEILVRKGLITVRIGKILYGRIQLTKSLSQAVKGSSFIVEAAPEILELKQNLWGEMDQMSHKDTIIATNSSTIPLSKIGIEVKHCDRIVGSHFMFPPHIVPIVEVSRGIETTNETMDSTITLWEKCGKTPVRLEKDVPGYIVNRLQAAIQREAMYLIEIGAATPKAIDTAVSSGFGLRWVTSGPVEHSDIGGLDVSMRFSEFMWPVLSNAIKPFPNVRHKVKNGELGLKSGRGHYDWSTDKRIEVKRDRAERLIDTVVMMDGWRLPEDDWEQS